MPCGYILLCCYDALKLALCYNNHIFLIKGIQTKVQTEAEDPVAQSIYNCHWTDALT